MEQSSIRCNPVAEGDHHGTISRQQSNHTPKTGSHQIPLKQKENKQRKKEAKKEK